MQIEEHFPRIILERGLEFKRFLFPADTTGTVTNTDLSVFSCKIQRYVLLHVAELFPSVDFPILEFPTFYIFFTLMFTLCRLYIKIVTK